MEVVIRKGVQVDVGIPESFPQWGEDDFFHFATSLRDLRAERDKDGNIFIMPPTGLETGNFELQAGTELELWNRAHKLGKTYSSSAGFTLPNGAIRSPDAAWVSHARLAGLSAEDQKKFAHICPDFVIEICSESDRLEDVQAKMQEYIENGALLGFLIDPKEAQAFIYRADGSVEQIRGLDDELSGDAVLPGFVLPLSLFKS